MTIEEINAILAESPKDLKKIQKAIKQYAQEHPEEIEAYKEHVATETARMKAEYQEMFCLGKAKLEKDNSEFAKKVHAIFSE